MSKIQKFINYSKVFKDIKAIIRRGLENLQAVYRQQAVKTNWEVGKYLNETFDFDEGPSARNAQIMRRLSKELDRPDTYFYALIKFYKFYPTLPVNAHLSWSHYEALLRIDDPGERQAYALIACQKHLSSKKLNSLLAHDKAKQSMPLVFKNKKDKKLSLKRGRLYHYQVTAPTDAQKNTGTATVNVGFNIYRDIDISKKSRMHVGHMVRTVKEEGAEETFTAKIANFDKDRLYTFKAEVVRVVDGDTLILMVDCGFKTKTKQRLRLRGINCAELTTAEGRSIKDYVNTLLKQQEFVIIKTYKDDKFGRMLTDVFYLLHEKDPHRVVQKGIFLNQQLLDEGLADIWE